MTPQELLDAARDLMQRPGASLDGIWPRAAALLARQALEAAMAELWAAHRQTAALSASPMRSQELCLTAYLNPATASRLTYLLAALSQACHYHPYELAPTAAELTTWLDQATHLVTQLHAASTVPAPPGHRKSLCRTEHDASPHPDSPRSRPERPRSWQPQLMTTTSRTVRGDTQLRRAP